MKINKKNIHQKIIVILKILMLLFLKENLIKKFLFKKKNHKILIEKVIKILNLIKAQNNFKLLIKNMK